MASTNGVPDKSKTALAVPPKLSDYPSGSWVLTVWFFAAMVWGWVTTWLLQILFTSTIGWFIGSKTRLQYWNGHLFRFFSAKMTTVVVPFISVRKTKTSWTPTKEMINGKTGVMVVSNHRSFMDPFALGSVMYPLECKYVAKADLFNVPFGGWAMERAGDLKVKFDKNKNQGWGTVKGSTGMLLQQAKEQLTAGNSVAMFPEGTRMGYDVAKSKEAKQCIMPFKPAFFDLAKQLQVPIVCVAMKGTDDAWPVGSNMIRPFHIIVDVAPPIDPDDFASDVDLAEAAREKLGAMYSKLCAEGKQD